MTLHPLLQFPYHIPAGTFTWLSSLTLYVGIPAVCERRSILLRAFSTDNDLSHISFRTALRYSTQVKHRPVDTVTTSWSPQQPMSKNPYHHFLRFVALKSLIQMRFSISHCPITETASTLRRRKVRKGNQPIKKRENYHRMYRRCFYATLRDLSKHRPRNLDKLRDRIGGCLGAFSLKSR